MKVGIELRTKAKDKSIGTLNVRITNKGTRKYKSLKIDIPVKYWNVDKQQVKSNYIHSKQVNELIANEIAKYQISGLEGLKSTHITAIGYFRSEVLTYKESTQKNYNKTIKNFAKFLQYKGLESIQLSELSNELMKDWLSYLQTSTTANNNTIKTHISIIGSLINRAINEDLVNYYRHPMKGIKVKRIKPKTTYLTHSELKKLISFEGTKYDMIAKDIYTFQVFSQGMRISDALLLKWGNIELVENEIYIQYVTIKNKKRIYLKMNEMLFNIIDSYMYSNDKDTALNTLKSTLNELQTEYNKLKEPKYLPTPNISHLKVNKVEILNNIQDIPNVYNKEVKNEDIKNYEYQLKKEVLISKIESIKLEIFRYRLSKMNLNKNVFFFNKNLMSYKPGTEMNSEQLKSKDAIVSTLNMRLKRICKELSIKGISTHTARHSYAMLALDNDISVQELSISLAHSNLATTYNYIHSLPINKLTKKVDIIASKFI